MKPRGLVPGGEHPLAVALRAAFGRHRDAVLQAPTGAGKSTLVPLALLQEDFIQGGKILMLEPRRLAARAVAGRMASLLSERVGDTVGYRMRLDTRVSRATRIEVVTEGVLTRLLQEDPALEQVACLIFDEYHERSLAADLGLAFALDARRELGAAFRVLIMSATLDGERVAALLGDAEVVSVPGRAFPVELRYLGRALPLLPPAAGFAGAAFAAAATLDAVTSGVRRALEESAGDVLVFLPGAGEIRRVEALLLEAGVAADVKVLPLYGDMSAAAQDAVLAPAAAGSRKVVLATNIAETSLTIPGVTAVVDCGLVRRSHFDPATGMSRLEVARISRAASEQRAGRAGRVAPGICYRLWGEGAQASLAPAVARCAAGGDAAAGARIAAASGCPECAGAHDGCRP
jgi:ATP-dependent helicase HrpB